MFRFARLSHHRAGRFPHARGDVPKTFSVSMAAMKFSPRTWGCSERESRGQGRARVFPTHVGMFRSLQGVRFRPGSFPHARGDVPGASPCIYGRAPFSPRTWGCSGWQVASVFPTHVGMFRFRSLRYSCCSCFPHARGDVPARARSSARVAAFSPRTWGCSVRRELLAIAEEVFPTHVGMFRSGSRYN